MFHGEWMESHKTTIVYQREKYAGETRQASTVIEQWLKQSAFVWKFNLVLICHVWL
jgi:hypothetical protein